MKSLIVNADDLGSDEPRNTGIFEAIEAGVVTSVSVLTNGPAFKDAIRRIHSSAQNKVSFGIHLNLSEGRPLTRNLRLLVGPDGFFLGKAKVHGLFAQQGDSDLKEEIYREAVAQIEALLNAGIPVTHMDGHQHIQVFPAVIEIAVRVAEKSGIPWIRIPDELPERRLSGGLLDAEALLYSGFAARAWTFIEKSKVRTTDHFRGLYLKGRLTPESLEKTLETLPDGITELMVHPGRAPSGKSREVFSPFSTRDREMELIALIERKFRDNLVKHNIALVRFPEDNA
jgi:predicted glycoside hydrolase/deacetylase ChbG (UPF0249 family)